MAQRGGSSRGLPLPKNGCLRLGCMYLASLIALVGGLAVMTSGILGHLALPGLPVISGSTSSTSSTGGIVPVSSSQIGGSAPTGATGATISRPRSANSPQGGVLTAWSTNAFYIVQSGDSLDSIAARYGTTADALLQYNPGLTRNIQPDQLIYLPGTVSPLPGTGRKSGTP